MTNIPRYYQTFTISGRSTQLRSCVLFQVDGCCMSPDSIGACQCWWCWHPIEHGYWHRDCRPQPTCLQSHTSRKVINGQSNQLESRKEISCISTQSPSP